MDTLAKCIETGGNTGTKWVNLLQLSVVFHIETSHQICTANQMTGF